MWFGISVSDFPVDFLDPLERQSLHNLGRLLGSHLCEAFGT
jgi:hypothetical protein